MPFSFSDVSIPVSIFLGLYGLFLLFYVVYAFFNILNLLKHGRISMQLFVIITVFVAGSIFLVAGSFLWLSHYDWTLNISLNDTLQALKPTPLHAAGGF